MTYEHNEQWRMQIILSLAWQETQPVIKRTEDGEEFSCFVQYLDGKGLIQITNISADEKKQRVYRFDRYGGLRGIFEIHADGSDDLIYDRDSSFGSGHRHETEVNCSAMISRLEPTLTTEEESAFYL